MLRLIRVFGGHTGYFVGFVMHRLISIICTESLAFNAKCQLAPSSAASDLDLQCLQGLFNGGTALIGLSKRLRNLKAHFQLSLGTI